MKRVMILVLFALLASGPGLARVEVKQFDSPEQEERYDKLVTELRCLVCQNQNLADSNAELAVDMRRKTYEMVKQNKSEKEIADFMVARYGEFVLYRPPLNSSTLLLWGGPFIILLIGVTLLLRTIRKRRTVQTDAINETDRQAAAALLDSDSDKRDA
ncbi:MAG: cytochrome c-type biogenesis protein CcmH [Gammaproteobacteria bacterium]|nr:cytochrome c-type biogenesis protein CcmH [Gammaproteobacteria bacterium]